jgi:hypothetical protein
MKESSEICKITDSTTRNQIKIKKVDMRNFILKYDAIDDALKVICNINLKRPRNCGDIGTGRNLAKNREIAKVFCGDIGPRYIFEDCITFFRFLQL